MAVYLKKFQDSTEYNQYVASNDFVLPNVSLISSESAGTRQVEFHAEYDPLNGHQFIDLGLPSGNLWAKCNVGARNETQRGYYFQWGDPNDKTKNLCTWGDYLYWDNTPIVTKGDDRASMMYKFTKYYESDGLTLLEPWDDPACVIMGGPWETPSIDDFIELSANTTIVYTAYTLSDEFEVYGIQLTSNINGNKLFLPRVGGKEDGRKYGGGYYWTNQVWSGESYSSAYKLHFDEQHEEAKSGGDVIFSIDYINNFRRRGLPIRAVAHRQSNNY